MQTDPPTLPARPIRLRPSGCDGTIMLVTMISVAILLLIVGVTMLSTTNKYFTTYQWASWQEALQGAESGADMAMAELRKDVRGTAGAWAGWKVGTYSIVNGVKVRDAGAISGEKTISPTGYFSNNSGGGSGNATPFSVDYFTKASGSKLNDYLYYQTELTRHGGEGNTNLASAIFVDAPASLKDPSGRYWLRVRATGTTDIAGPVRVSEEGLDNRLRKLTILTDRFTGRKNTTTNNKPTATRTIELVAKPVTLFAGALMTQVQFKNDDQGVVTDSFNSEDRVTWPLLANGDIDMSKARDISKNPDGTYVYPQGKNGDIGSNAFPSKRDKLMEMKLNNDFIFGDAGNNYSPIKGLDPAYFTAANPNPDTTLIKTDGNAIPTGQVSANFYRELPKINPPNWLSPTLGTVASITGGKTYVVPSIDPNAPSTLVVNKIDLNNTDKLIFNPKSSTGDYYVSIYVKENGTAGSGEIKLKDGGTFLIADRVHATVYFDKNIEVTDTKTNFGGFDVLSDDAKDLIILGVEQPDAKKMPKDSWIDPVTGLETIYTPWKASGNIHFKDSDFTGAIYAPDHNVVIDSMKDFKGKRRIRLQKGNDYYGSYVGRTIHTRKDLDVHFDESLNDAGPALDWGYVSWFEDVDVDNR